jgi:hypothetical protein
MAVAFDAITNSTLTSFTHTPVGTPRGVLIFFTDDTTLADRVSDPTYGGVACTEVTLSPLTNDGTDNHVIHAFFLGSSIPTGAQTVAYTASAGTQRIGCITYTAAADTEVKDTSTIAETTPGTGDRTVTLSLGGAAAACALAFGTDFGATSSFAPLADWTAQRESDEGTNCTGLYTYDIVGTTDVTAGVAFGANSGELACLAVAIGEVAAGGGSAVGAGLTKNVLLNKRRLAA